LGEGEGVGSGVGAGVSVATGVGQGAVVAVVVEVTVTVAVAAGVADALSDVEASVDVPGLAVQAAATNARASSGAMDLVFIRGPSSVAYGTYSSADCAVESPSS
jgi:hypothetical protein